MGRGQTTSIAVSGGLCFALLAASAARAATWQNFRDPGTPYATGGCGPAPEPELRADGPGGANFLRLLRGGDFWSINWVGLERSDPGAFTSATIDLDFRITPGSGRADGFAMVLLDTAIHGAGAGSGCLAYEEANVRGSLGIGFDVYHNPHSPAEDPDNNHLSVHFDGARVAAVPLGSSVDLASGDWIHARIEVRAGAEVSDVSITLTPEGGAPVAVLTGLEVPGLRPYEARLYVAARTGGESADHDIANLAVGFAGDPAVVGAWTPVPLPLPVVAIHSALLPNGKVFFFDRRAEGTDTTPRLWDPLSGAITKTPHPGVEIFCSGHNFDAQGRLLVFGGHNHHDGFGLETAFAYDFVSNQFSALPRMNAGRWYPTNTLLGNGDTLVIAGTITPEHNNLLPQVFETRTGLFRDLSHATRDLPYYPMMFVAPDGRVFNAGPNVDSAFLDPRDTGHWSPAIPSNFGARDYGTAVLYDEGKVALIGGGYVTNSMELIDIGAAHPSWRYGSPMAFARRQHNALVLPDGKVLVTGGSSTPEFNNAAGAVLAAETWDPADGGWSTGAAMQVPRIYHSETVLLPDGRVASLGGGHPAAVGGENNFNLEIYSPPYLFRTARPTISAAPLSAAHGQTIRIETEQAAAVAQVNLIRRSAVTHSFNMDQRIVRLAFSRSAGAVEATLPANPNLAPPGPYLLFIVDAFGVPSVAHDLSVQTAYEQDGDHWGIVAIELERHHAQVTAGAHAWITVAPEHHLGTGALAALPNKGTNVDTGYDGGSPRVDYWINFRKTGRHYVWLRAKGANGGDDSCHVGLDGMPSSTGDRITGFRRDWTWSRTTMDRRPATIDVPSPGLHRVSVWMREDGLFADRLVLSTSPYFAPLGPGPAE